ncbi:MAG: DUF1273 family protein [Christensenellaceae bacterium]|nr:DUF1273 family protein [Christensenellaceae bacterium]
MKNHSCCFTGHREITDDYSELKKRLERELVELIKQGIYIFYSGGASGFDLLASESILELQKNYPHIQLHLILPYKKHTTSRKKEASALSERICEQANHIDVLAERFYPGCFHVRNRRLVDSACVCICYQRKENGGTAYTVKYAEEKGLSLIKI